MKKEERQEWELDVDMINLAVGKKWWLVFQAPN